ncbi:hypothetical protein BSNT_06327 [Bacillus subtilis subsp. natto BEST195]|nr:hypothetical protein BSNT_06327 [Bacillus subtilis subsp. natto BEST195]
MTVLSFVKSDGTFVKIIGNQKRAKQKAVNKRFTAR